MKALFFLVFCLLLLTGYAQDILIRNINVVDVTHEKIHYDRNLYISKGVIKKVSKKRLSAKKREVINGKGKYMIPGLWDMHVHMVDSSYLDLFIINGITGIRDMGGAAEHPGNGCESIRYEKLSYWRQLVQSGSLRGPRMIISGPAVSNTGWPTSINLKSPDDARRAVTNLRELGVDFIKVYEGLSLETYLALAKEAKAIGLPFSGHVPVESVTLIEASNAGQSSIEHIRDPLLMCFSKNREELIRFFEADHWSRKDIDWGLQQFGQCDNIVEVFKKNHTWLVPTLVVERAKVAIHDPMHVNDEKRNVLPKTVIDAFQKYVNEKLDLPDREKKSDSLWWATQKLLVKRMHVEEIPMMAGTDCACQGGIPGYSLHKELELFVEAGLTPFEALRTATINPAVFLHMESMLGTIEKGKMADLVILDSNPVENISSTRSIHAVIYNGRLVSKKESKKY